MPSYDKYKKSNYIQKSDLVTPQLLTILRVTEEDVSMNDQPTDMKFVIHFKEDFKPWVPGISMLEMIHHITGDGDVDHWDHAYRADHGLPELKIVMYVDPNVAFRGKIVGGIRCRPPKPGYQAPVDETQSNTEPPPTNDDIPF
jgi:hypothetical protein